jgi:2,4-dienoyl-CoA reductase-like NADH-dependent reductase (Old Yellow Enzyme family)
MCQYSDVNGMADNWHLVHLGRRAVGGAGLVITEALAVAPRGRISPADLGLWSGHHIPPLERIAAFLKRQGAVPGCNSPMPDARPAHASLGTVAR